MEPTTRGLVGGVLTRWFGRLRFPKLFIILLGLFAVDFIVPDAVPFLEEMILAVLTLIVGSLKDRQEIKDSAGDAAPDEPKVKNVTPP